MSTGLRVKEDTDVMETTDPKTAPAADARVNRRAFIRTTGVAAAMAGSIEGICRAAHEFRLTAYRPRTRRRGKVVDAPPQKSIIGIEAMSKALASHDAHRSRPRIL